jgi:hypothetical protein
LLLLLLLLLLSMKQTFVLAIALPLLLPFLNSLFDPQVKSVEHPVSYLDHFQNRCAILGHRGSR